MLMLLLQAAQKPFKAPVCLFMLFFKGLLLYNWHQYKKKKKGFKPHHYITVPLCIEREKFSSRRFDSLWLGRVLPAHWLLPLCLPATRPIAPPVRRSRNSQPAQSCSVSDVTCQPRGGGRRSHPLPPCPRAGHFTAHFALCVNVTVRVWLVVGRAVHCQLRPLQSVRLYFTTNSVDEFGHLVEKIHLNPNYWDWIWLLWLLLDSVSLVSSVTILTVTAWWEKNRTLIPKWNNKSRAP